MKKTKSVNMFWTLGSILNKSRDSLENMPGEGVSTNWGRWIFTGRPGLDSERDWGEIWPEQGFHGDDFAGVDRLLAGAIGQSAQGSNSTQI